MQRYADNLGSSPLTRGKRPSIQKLRLFLGLIPAHAGKTVTRLILAGLVRAHPRSRGENPRASCSLWFLLGSSPLTRGKRIPRFYLRWAHGLIPAHAGKTAFKGTRFKRSAAHPRSRGENSPQTSVRVTLPGSSPLTRGKRSRRVAMPKRQRLIPAHAGKTCTTPVATSSPDGSSPLTRGKPSPRLSPCQASGLIPAHAGKTRMDARRALHPRAHPRSRGENAHMSAPATLSLGSSPLTRGKPPTQCPQRDQERLIPAHAGKTTTRPRATPRP